MVSNDGQVSVIDLELGASESSKEREPRYVKAVFYGRYPNQDGWYIVSEWHHPYYLCPGTFHE
jgi:hypothetical protein